MKPKNNKALREWATIVKTLGEVKQTILIRKRELKSTYDEFFLYPTFTRQTKDKFKHQFHSDFDTTVISSAKGKLMIEFYAQIMEVCEVTKRKKLLDLDSYYIWTSSHVEDYFQKKYGIMIYPTLM